MVSRGAAQQLSFILQPGTFWSLLSKKPHSGIGHLLEMPYCQPKNSHRGCTMRTTVIGTPSFSDASAMIEACHTELLRAGFIQEANSLLGAEIYSESHAATVLSTLRKICVDNEAVNSAVRYASAMLEALLRQASEMPLAS